MAAPKKITDTISQMVAVMTHAGCTQQQICDRLDLSPPSARKALKQARSAGWLHDRPVLTLPASVGLALLMGVAIAMHVKVKDPPKKSLPAMTMFTLSVAIAILSRL